MPLDVERRRAGTGRLVREAHALHAGVDRDGEAVGGRGLEDGQVLRVAVGPLAAAGQQHLDKAAISGAALDLGDGGNGILRGHDDRAAEAVVDGEPVLAEPVVVGAGEGGGAVGVLHEADAEGVIGREDADVCPLVVEHLLGDDDGVAAGHAVLIDSEVAAEPRGRVRPRIRG